MFANLNNVKSNKPGILTAVARKLKLAAAVAAVSLGIASISQAAVSDVTSITTNRYNTGITTTHFGVTGQWATATPANVYTTSYLGNVEGVTSVTTSAGTFVPSGVANAVVRRYKGPNTDILWYRSAPNANNGPTSPTQTLDSIEATNFEQAFSANNILVGTDNLFTNTNNPAGNNTNVERLDVIFGSGFASASTKAFALFDRGFTGVHDKVKVAAITGIDLVTGKPTSYGSMLTLSQGSWGNTNLTGTQDYVVVRRNNDVPNDAYHPSVWLSQGLGGVLIPTSDLATAGTTVYGYSIFAADVASPNPDWTTYPTSTQESSGGLDAIGTVALVYTIIPEPSSLGLLGASAGLLVSRRRARKN